MPFLATDGAVEVMRRVDRHEDAARPQRVAGRSRPIDAGRLSEIVERRLGEPNAAASGHLVPEIFVETVEVDVAGVITRIAEEEKRHRTSPTVDTKATGPRLHPER